MRARDGGTPSLSSTVVLTVSVNHNLFAPLFLQNSYTVEISETTAPGTGILFVSASDNDVTVMEFLSSFVVFRQRTLKNLLIEFRVPLFDMTCVISFYFVDGL